jgi:hypothetical protein
MKPVWRPLVVFSAGVSLVTLGVRAQEKQAAQHGPGEGGASAEAASSNPAGQAGVAGSDTLGIAGSEAVQQKSANGKPSPELGGFVKRLNQRGNEFCVKLNQLAAHERKRFEEGYQPASALCPENAWKNREATDPEAELLKTEGDLAEAEGKLKAFVSQYGAPLVDELLRARCQVAICFGENRAVGIEPLVELPIGKSFSASTGPVADYVNNHDIQVDLAAGIRVWGFRDIVSLAVYLSRPLSDRSVRIPGSDFQYPSTALRRPYPGVALGLLWDSIWLGFDRDELRNPDSTVGVTRDPGYPPNALVGSSWTLTLALQPVTAFRTGIGLLSLRKEERKP